MMKVKTIFSGLANGFPNALGRLDREVESLGNVTIHSVQDTLYEGVNRDEGMPMEDKMIVRVVIYTPKKK